MRILAFIIESPVIGKIMRQLGEKQKTPQVTLARETLQAAFATAQNVGLDSWPESDQTAG
jgi:hypothetical protein